MKLSHLFVSGAVYEEVAAELRERDRLEAHRLREETSVLKERISGEARADRSVDEVRIDVDRARRIADEHASAPNDYERPTTSAAEEPEPTQPTRPSRGPTIASWLGAGVIATLVTALSVTAFLLS
jgi:hypothetical protein